MNSAMQISKTFIIPNTMFLQNMYKYYIRSTDCDFIPSLGISDADWNGWARGCLRDNLDKLLAETPSERNQRPVYRSTLSEGLERLITNYNHVLWPQPFRILIVLRFFSEFTFRQRLLPLSHMNFLVGERVAVTSNDLHGSESCLEFEIIDNLLSSPANIIDEDIVCLT